MYLSFFKVRRRDQQIDNIVASRSQINRGVASRPSQTQWILRDPRKYQEHSQLDSIQQCFNSERGSLSELRGIRESFDDCAWLKA